MVAGSLLTRSPLFYEVKPSVHSKLAVIPLTIFNNYSVPVAITRIGIPDAAATLLSTSDKASTRRFTVCVTFSPHSQLTRSFSAFAPPKRPFSPLYFVFHVARFRSQLWVRGAGVTSRQRSVFSAVVAVTTNLTSFSVELVAYDGLLSVYSSSSVITTAWGPLAFLPRSSFQQDSINWGTRLPFSYTAAFSASSLYRSGPTHTRTVLRLRTDMRRLDCFSSSCVCFTCFFSSSSSFLRLTHASLSHFTSAA